MSKDKRLNGHLHEVYDDIQLVKSEMGLTGNLSDKACLARLIEAYRAVLAMDTVPAIDGAPEEDTAHEIEVDTIIALCRYSVAELDEINRGLSVEYVDIWSDIKEGLLLVVRQRNQYLAPEHNLQDAQTRKAKQVGTYEHVEATIAALMHANEEAEHTMDQLYLSIGAVRKVAHAREKTVRAYFAAHQDMIDMHNQTVVGIGSAKHGERHNMLRSKYLQAKRRGTGAQFLARYGAQLVTPNGSNISGA